MGEMSNAKTGLLSALGAVLGGVAGAACQRGHGLQRVPGRRVLARRRRKDPEREHHQGCLFQEL